MTVKIAKGLPTPKPLTDAELDALNKEGHRLAKIAGERGKRIERLTGEDLATRLR